MRSAVRSSTAWLARSSAAAAGLLALAGLLAGGPAGAAESDRLLGRWRTPGGNLIDIRADARGALAGVLVEVTPEAAAVGFRVGATSVSDIVVRGARVEFNFTVRTTDPDFKDVCREQREPFRGDLSEDGRRITGEARAGRFEGKEQGGRRQCTYTPGTEWVPGYVYERPAPQAEGVLITEAEPPFRPVDVLPLGQPFRVEVVYPEPGMTEAAVTVRPGAGGALTQTARPTADPRRLRTPAVRGASAPAGATVVAEGPDGRRTQATVTDVCQVVENEAGRTTTRAAYERWIKDLICAYLVADFGRKEARRDFVERVLAALQAHARDEGVRLRPDATIVHIVVHRPVAYDPPATTRRVDGAAARRSLRQPDRSAIGVNEALFRTPRPTDRAAADAIVPAAETAILTVFGLKKLADLIVENPAGLAAGTATTTANEAIAAFQRRLVTQATIPTVTSDDLGARPAPPPAAPEPSWDDARNLAVAEPGPRAVARPITAVTGALGMTRSANSFKTSSGVIRVPPDDVESIEEADVLTADGRLVEVVVRSRLVIAVGVPGATERVVSQRGADCTEAIKRHELQHAADVWQAWRVHAIDGLAAALGARSFDGQLGRTTVAVSRVTADGSVVVDIRARYRFGAPRAANTALGELRRMVPGLLGDARRAYNRASADAEARFHAREDSLDDDCQPTVGGQRRYGAIEQRTAPGSD